MPYCLIALFQVTMFIPLIVVILERDGFTNFMTYSPSKWEDNKNYRKQLNNLLNRVQDELIRAHRVDVKGVYVKHIETPLINRYHLCYFSTYSHFIGDHKPLHVDSPVFFVLCLEENDYVL